MAIAANFRKFPMAMALQLVLPFGKPVWNTKRPTTRRGRAFRAHVVRVMKLVGLRVEPVVMAVPQWWKNAQKRAKLLAKEVKADCIELDFRAPIKRASVVRQAYEMGLYQWG